ncbi:MAG: PhzF family phenazine biosynthesis protein [Planctomycetes bacterium]|nr:PhzF family phenazine biosynthesis protein [Planctomycetota bacterium]
MPRTQYLRVDVFTTVPFSGNPLAVFPDADAIPPSRMQAIAREMNLSETVFCVRSAKPQADVRLRIFTIDRELPLAGHPTIGAVFALASTGRLPLSGAGDVVWCELGVGVLPVEVESRSGIVERVVMTQREPRFGEAYSRVDRVAAALGVTHAALCPGDLPIRVVDTGIPWLIVPVVDLHAIRRIAADPSRCAAIASEVDTDAFYAFTQDVVDSTCTAHARHVAFGSLTPGEDPATGSAAGCLASYLVGEGIVLASPNADLTIEQGLEVNRPSRIEAMVETEAGKPKRVRVGGRAVLLGDGSLEV